MALASRLPGMAALTAPDRARDGGPAGCDLALKAITQRYGAALALDNVSLAIAGGELLALLDPSGCGKTTPLRIIAGFVAQTSGRVLAQLDWQLAGEFGQPRGFGLVHVPPDDIADDPAGHCRPCGSR
jgi:ABC-type multidrug transport system fused ATPase/permease subunit